MPEIISKLQPDRTVSLRGFDSFAAAASIHSASPSGFQVSGTFRDAADFAVAVLYDADNVYEHPVIKYLPDFNFAGLTLNFSLLYNEGLQPIDSPKFNWIDWATLDCILADGSTAQVRLWDNAMLADSSFQAPVGVFTVTSSGIVQPYDRVTLWFQNLAFDYIVPAQTSEVEFLFYAAGTGTVHSITINGRTYPYTETNPAGESSADVAAGLIKAVNSPGDPDVIASPGTVGYAVGLQVRPAAAGKQIPVSADNGSVILYLSTPALVAGQIVDQINGTDWLAANTTHALIASNDGAQITVTAARYGTVNVSGTSVTWVSGARFAGITAGSAIQVGGAQCSVASVQSPIQLTLSAPLSDLNGAMYVAPRGGRDGNMIQLYSLSKTSTLSIDRPTIQLSGGNSQVTWNCTLDFTALGIDQLRQCWLTFAPPLTNGAAFTTTEWLATFSNWALTGPADVATLKVAGPGSVRIEEDDTACVFTGTWVVEAGFYSKYFATGFTVAPLHNPIGSLTVTYTCQFTHDLYVGTSLYGDRAIAGVELDGVAINSLNCFLKTDSAVVTRRLLHSSVGPGKHTVKFTISQTGVFYFDFLEAAVLSDIPVPLKARTNISPALDFDTDQTYKLSPARLMWIMDQLGYAGPMNEYLGVFWWNERKVSGGTVSSAQVAFTGNFSGGDSIVLYLNGTAVGKTVFPADTLTTIANHFAAYINETFVAAWASASDGNLTITGRSPAAAYNLTISLTVNSTTGQASYTLVPAVDNRSWVIDDSVSPPINRATRDWHADYYAQCAARSLEVVTACSMELVNPPDGYTALFPSQTAVSTKTGFGTLLSNQCAIGGSKMLAYQKAVYRTIAQMQSTAGLTPSVQYGEFLWWFFAGPGGMAYYDPETAAAAQIALGRPLHVFLTPNDDPSVSGGADALFLRNRLRDHVAALIADIRGEFPTAKCEVLWPYDVNYPTPVPLDAPIEGGQLNRYVNLPVEWQQQASSGLDTMKVEALAFGTGMRNLDLAWQAITLFPDFGWPVASVRYLVPVFGSATPWVRELALVWAAGLKVANLWAFDHICLFNLDVPERALERRSIVKTA